MSHQLTSKVYIFAQMQAGEYVPAAVLLSANGSYSFGYTKSWMARGDAFALDPINLPLTDSIYRDDFLWSCFDDTIPDNWGRRVILIANFFRLSYSRYFSMGHQWAALDQKSLFPMIVRNG